MTEFVIQLKDESKTGVFIATLKQLAAVYGVDLSVKRNGEGIALDAADDDARFTATINQIIAGALAGKLAPLTEDEARADDLYWEKVGQELHLTDDEIVSIVKEERAKFAA